MLVMFDLSNNSGIWRAIDYINTRTMQEMYFNNSSNYELKSQEID